MFAETFRWMAATVDGMVEGLAGVTPDGRNRDRYARRRGGLCSLRSGRDSRLWRAISCWERIGAEAREPLVAAASRHRNRERSVQDPGETSASVPATVHKLIGRPRRLSTACTETPSRRNSSALNPDPARQSTLSAIDGRFLRSCRGNRNLSAQGAQEYPPIDTGG